MQELVRASSTLVRAWRAGKEAKLAWLLGYLSLGLAAIWARLVGLVLGHEMGQNVKKWAYKNGLELGPLMGLYGP